MESNQCLCCGNDNLIEIINFGKQAAANLLMKAPFCDVEKQVLALNGCGKCGHMQQMKFYNPSSLFEEYLYQSNTSNTLKLYFNDLANLLKIYIPENGQVLEIASNDGSFLQALKNTRPDATLKGIDPAENIVEYAVAQGIETINDFYPSSLINDTFDLIVAQNVIAHTPNPRAMMNGIKNNLKQSGVCLIQVSQADMLDNGEFDTLYHEHYSFYSDDSMTSLAQNSGMKIVQILKNNIHGGSKCYLLMHQDSAPITKLVSNAVFENILFPLKTNILSLFNIYILLKRKNVQFTFT